MITLHEEVASKRKTVLNVNAKESLVVSITKQSQELFVLNSKMDKAIVNQHAWEKKQSNLNAQVKTCVIDWTTLKSLLP